MGEVDLSVEVAGFRFENPLVLSEGPLSGDARLIRRAAEHRVGAICTKSIRMQPALSANPYMIRTCHGKGLINADWTSIGFDAWMKELDQVKIRQPLMVNIGTNDTPPQQAGDLADTLHAHGADFVTFSDYEPENLVEAVAQARKHTDVPIMVKLPPFKKNIGDLCRRLEEAGVTMIAAMDAVGPAMDIDIETGRPILGNDGAYGYLSAEPIFPLTLADISEIVANVTVPVLGVGGVTSAEDAIKLIMAGATFVGLVGAPILKGLSVFDTIEADMRRWMEEHGIRSLNEIRGIAQPYIHPAEDTSLRAKVDRELCIGCGLCEKSCYQGAISIEEKKAVVDGRYCSGCGVCQTTCPKRAIRVC